MNENNHIYQSGDKRMATDVFKRIQEEIFSLTALSIVNIIFGALAIATGVSTTINRYFSMKEAAQFDIYSTALIGIGGILSIIGLWWIITSANIMDFSTDMHIEHHKKKSQVTEEVIISWIVQMVAYYRENKKTIRRMVQISRLGGIFFLSYGLILIVSELSGNIVLTDYTYQMIRTILLVCLSIACFLIPHFFSKYASIWDSRIEQAEKAEEALIQQMGSP